MAEIGGSIGVFCPIVGLFIFFSQREKKMPGGRQMEGKPIV
jgi:hypothetical protein